MDILFSLHKIWCNKILSGEKTIEFRTRLPKEIKSGSKIYFYETAKKGGSQKIVGECEVDYIIPILREDGKWPTYGAYPFIDYYFEYIKKDKEKAERYKEIKSEFLNKFENYKHGFILDFAFSEDDLENIREYGNPIDTFKIFDFNYAKEITKNRDIAYKDIKECDEWLTDIGFYNDMLESYYKYGIVLKNVITYNKPKELSEFMDRKNNIITKPPQSYMYIQYQKKEEKNNEKETKNTN